MKKIYFLLGLLVLSGVGFGQGLEDFTNSNATSSYADNNFVGQNGITWYYVASRNANGDANGSGITLPALMLRRSSSSSKVYSETIPGGIGNFSVKLYKGFTGSGNRQVELFINDVSYGTSTPFDDFNEHLFTVDNINISGNVVIRIDDITSKQVIVDDITWTGFGASGPDNPTDFVSAAVSTTEIDLSWTQSGNSDDVMVAWSSDGTFGIPADGTSYAAGNTIAGGGTVIYNANGTSYNHTGLTPGTYYYYKAWSVDGSTNYSSGTTDDATTFKNEPSNHVSDFAAGEAGATTIPLTWNDNDGAVVADGYLVFINTTGTFSAPVDGTSQSDDTDVSDGSGQVNIAHGAESYRWNGLSQNTQYYFAIYPYTNSGTAIDYKVDGTVPTASATTTVVFGAPDLFISEYIEGSGSNKALEIFNGTGAAIDLSNYQIWKISNGGNWPESTLSLSGTLANGDVYVIYNSGADASIVSVGDIIWGSATWNGDDAVGLAKDDGTGTFTLIDAVGEDGSDPGSGWDVAGVTNATKDHTLVRKSSVLSPNTNWSSSAGTNTSNLEWVVYDKDTLSYIGYHITNAPPVPLSDWAVILVALLILVFVAVKYKAF